MKKILYIWIIIAVILVGSLTFIGYKLTSENKPYYDLETKLMDAAKIYFGQYPEQLPDNHKTISSYKLIQNDFLDSIDINEEKCRGYVTVTKDYIFYEYEPFIKCENYMTKKYDSSLEGSS